MPANRVKTIWEWEPTEDGEITCILCGDDRCTHELTRRVDARNGSRRTVTIGIHEVCATMPGRRGGG
jgi:hypothetical protein